MKRRLLLRRLLSALAITAVITGGAWIALSASLFVGFQNRSTDSLFPASPDSHKVVVVGLDRNAVLKTGQTTWSRDKWAKVVDVLSKDGAAVIAFDFSFSVADRYDPANDALFADAIARAGNVVLGIGATESETPPDGPPIAKDGTSVVYQPLADVAAAIGHVQITQDNSDGVVRRVPLVIDIDDEYVPALSVAAVTGLRRQLAQPIVRPDGVQAGNRFIPADRSTNMTLNWTAPLSTPPQEISALDVLNDEIDPADFRGKIVFVGATDPLTGDLRPVPTDKSGRLPGVFIHANAANTMLTATYLEPASDAAVLGWVALVTALVALAVLMLPFWASPVVAFLLAVGYIVFAFARLDQGVILNLVFPLVSIAASFVIAMGVKYFAETRQRRRVTALFSQYVPEEVAQRLVDEDRAELAAEGQRLEMTVLFCDLRGFTAMSENLAPSVVRTMLDHYYDRVTELVLAMRGTLMKYVGDEVFAVWGAPMPSTDHPALALECAMEIQALTPSLNAELMERGAPEVAFGIGLNTGEAVAAHFGGGRRRQYDVVGDTVNVGARLCSAAGRGEIILSDAVLERVPDPPPVEPVGHVELKGVSRNLTLWRVLAAGADAPDRVSATRAAVARPWTVANLASPARKSRAGRCRAGSGAEQRRRQAATGRDEAGECEMHHGTERAQGGRRTPGRALRGLSALLVVVGSVSLVGVGVAQAASSSSKGAALATLKIKASGVAVKAKGAGSFVAAKEGQALQQGDALRTDATGKAEIAYTDGSLTRLGVATEFSITKLTDKKGARQTQGTLTVGNTWNRAAKVSESGEFSIKAGGATAAVEGTAFVVACPAASGSVVACTVTAIVDTVSVNSDDWTVTSVTDAS